MLDQHIKVAQFIGGNSTETAPAGQVADYVKSHGGHTVITKVLIANNGIAAVKEIRSVRQWSYETFGTERAIQFTVMATPEDLKVNADYIRMADQYIEVPGGTNNNNYANVDVIVDIAERAGVHAVWAGWGHASENPRLPEALHALEKPIVFIGPPGSAMRSLGDKISSTIVAQHADVPCMPWSGTGISDTVLSPQGFVTVPDDAYAKACVHNWEEGLERAEKIGFPVMIKASEGGGGKGIRKVDTPDAFKLAFGAVLGEVPGSPIFIMKLAGQARHLEVQLLADQYGNAISIFGRDCSVQRRHQKIIEEAPVTIAPRLRFEQMEKAAVRLAKLVGYVSAGTVEYLYSPGEDSFFFLELNPRLQVEHPTTEMVSGVNLPAAQLQVAMGIPLHRNKDIRVLYGAPLDSSSEIDFDFEKPESLQLQRTPRPKGHVIAVRITAENPDAGFKPSSGSLHELNFRSNTNVWGYFSVGTAGGLHEFADSQFGHIFAYGADRGESRKNMVMALKEMSIRGDFRTTVEYLIKLLQTEVFEGNSFTTGWLDTLITNNVTAERPDPTLAVICGAVTKAHLASEARWDEYKRTLDKGQVPSKDTLQTVFTVEFIYEGSRYAFTAARSSANSWTLYLNGGRTQVGARSIVGDGLLVLLDGKSHSVYWREEVGATRLLIDSKTCLIEQENDPTQLRSPSPGKLVRFLIESGDHVSAGEPYAEIEVMKMYMPLIVAEDGVVQFVKQPGVSLVAGDILGILTLDDPSRVKHAKPFHALLPPMGTPQVIGTKPNQKYAYAIEVLNNILEGYDNQAIMASTVKELLTILEDPTLPYADIYAVLAVLSGRIPAKLEELLRAAIDGAKAKNAVFPASRVRKILDSWIADDTRPQDRTLVRAQLSPLVEITERYRGGLNSAKWGAIVDLLLRYYDTEQLFGEGGSIEERVLKLRDENKDDLGRVAGLVLSHTHAQGKNKLVLALLDIVKAGGSSIQAIEPRLMDVVRDLASLESRSTNAVSLKAREVLIASQLPSYEERSVQMEQVLKQSVSAHVYGEQHFEARLPNAETLKELSDSRWTVYDVLPTFFSHDDRFIELAALEVYVRRAYRAYSLMSIDYEEGNGEAPAAVTWRFGLGQSNSPPLTPSVNNLTGKPRAGSVSDLTYFINKSQIEAIRSGAIASFPDLASLRNGLDKVAKLLPSFDADEFKQRHGVDAQAPNVLYLALRVFDEADDHKDEDWRKAFIELVNERKTIVDSHGVRRVTFLICRKGQYPWYFTLREQDGVWDEETAIRNIEPALAFQLELERLSHYNVTPCFLENRQIHIYHAVARENQLDKRFFIRAIVRPGRLNGTLTTAEYLVSESDRLVGSILDALEIVSSQQRNTDCNHISLNFIYNLNVTYEAVLQAIAGFIDRHGKRLWRLRVTGAEIRIVLEDADGNVTPIRAIVENVSGFVMTFHGYQEVTTEKGSTILKSIGEKGPLHLQPVHYSYPTKESLQPKRYAAHLAGTTYVYDFPDLFQKSLHNLWNAAKLRDPSLVSPKVLLESKELVLDEHDELQEVDRLPGNNNVGMIGWTLTLHTPEYPQGRKVVVIANDITYKIGTFGPAEDYFFHHATLYARAHGLPRIYLSANSGARIGLAEEALHLFSVAWNVPGVPDKGFKYVYLTEEAKKQLESKSASTIRTVEIEEEGEVRHMITGIIASQDGIGMDTLRAAGLIAGDTARAYDDIFTITLVTARSVGIGAYLVRLGQRAVQVEGQPMILTGAAALNKVLGREVYTSNLQLGGTQIMYKNGVSHLVASSDLDGTTKILQWLSYVPDVKGNPLPVLETTDPLDREIGYYPPKGPYDPRWFIDGKEDEATGDYLSGFFDKGSFQETLSGWAQNVVVGRARLGGIPMGVIAAETRSIERVVPADPANAASFEQKIMEAGQVWYPNSALKTAQAIMDFQREGLPLLIFANWRGFSGGQQDMLDEILKKGSQIVNGLSAYTQPVFIYIIPNGELRGGAFAVLDPYINPEQMEMYADEESRASVLEPEPMVEIKLRRDKLTKLMDRLDPEYSALKKEANDVNKVPKEKADAAAKLAAREEHLQPTFKALGILYADLHDRADRLGTKGYPTSTVWKKARPTFYWALRRKLIKSDYIKAVRDVSPSATRDDAENLVFSLLPSTINVKDDRAVAEALQAVDLEETLNRLRSSEFSRQVSSFIQSKSEQVALAGLINAAQSLSDQERALIRAAFEHVSPL